MRSHLSIGEVLSLLQEEFPDVTISKIRFLESQGLVDPERTPSGYRKFYEPDIERLRWVLRQQRDAFLPLKVIKGRLEGQSDLLEGTDGQPPPPAATGTGQGHPEGDAPSEGGVPGAESEARPRTDAPGQHPGPGQAPVPSQPALPERNGRSNGTERFEAAPPYSSYGVSGAVPERGVRERGGVLDEGRWTGQAPPSGPQEGPGRAPSSARVPGAHVTSRPAPPQTGHRRGRARDLRGDGEPEEMSLDDLVAQTGVDPATVQDLERYGLVSARTVAGTAYYTPEAAVIATLAAAFARHGVEARHLRAFKAAADREAGLVQQVIMPLIRQRNPEARQAAADAIEDLSHLGGELRAVLLQTALSQLR